MSDTMFYLALGVCDKPTTFAALFEGALFTDQDHERVYRKEKYQDQFCGKELAYGARYWFGPTDKVHTVISCGMEKGK